MNAKALSIMRCQEDINTEHNMNWILWNEFGSYKHVLGQPALVARDASRDA